MNTLNQIQPVLTLIEALPIAIVVVDHAGCLGAGNEAFLSLWRLEPAYLDARPSLSDFLNRLRDQRHLPEQSDFSRFRNDLVARATSHVSFVDQWYLPNGGTVQLKIAPLDQDNNVLIMQDLTPQLSLERAFKETVQTHQATLDNLQEGLAVFGSNGRLKIHNPPFTEIWHLPEDAFDTAFHMTDFLDATRALLPMLENWPARRAKLSGRLLGRKAGVDQLVLNTQTVLEAAHIPLPDGAVLLRYADVTASVTLAETLQERAVELSERADLLAAADHLKSEFLANLSHEIRTPLTTISGFAELLAGDYFGDLNKRQQEYANGIKDASTAATGLIGDILDLASIEAGALTLNVENLNLHHCLADVLSLIGERIRQNKLKLQFECPIDIGWIMADEIRLKQCLMHILNNAMTFSNAGGTITIAADRQDNEVHIEIRDTGIGIPKAEIENVFKGFERGEVADSRKPGAGLGLTLVKAFMELQGGSAEIVSKPNQGTTVRLLLPVEQPSE